MSVASAVLAESDRRGINLVTRAGKLVVDAPVGTLDDEFRTLLIEAKPELIRLLDHNAEQPREAGLEAPATPPLTVEVLVGPLWAEARQAMTTWSRSHRRRWAVLAEQLEASGVPRLEADKRAFVVCVHEPQAWVVG